MVDWFLGVVFVLLCARSYQKNEPQIARINARFFGYLINMIVLFRKLHLTPKRFVSKQVVRVKNECADSVLHAMIVCSLTSPALYVYDHYLWWTVMGLSGVSAIVHKIAKK
jgi:predicted membrane channel-forming protein YqfA (hemolysin III family)